MPSRNLDFTVTESITVVAPTKTITNEVLGQFYFVKFEGGQWVTAPITATDMKFLNPGKLGGCTLEATVLMKCEY